MRIALRTIVVGAFAGGLVAWLMIVRDLDTTGAAAPPAATNALERHSPTNYPHPEFLRGFDAGVRYGLIARIELPEEDSIPVITDRARYWYYAVVVDPTGTINRAVGKTNSP